MPVSFDRAKTRDALRRVGAFADQDDEQLDWFLEHAEERRLEPGEILFRRGDPAVQMAVYLEGEIHARRDDQHLDSPLYVARAGDPSTEITGKLPFSRMVSYPSTSRATVPTRLLLFPEALFPELLARMPAVAPRLVGLLSDRVRESTRADEQRDKLMALGKLSAGLAHELNNPAAAARRSAGELLATLEQLRAADLRLCRHELTDDHRRAIAEVEAMALESADARKSAAARGSDPLARSTRESALEDWLDAHDVEGGWELAPTLADAGVTPPMLDSLQRILPSGALPDVVARLASQLATARLVSDIQTSTGRISELVGAVKEYTFMDQGAVQEVDLHRGLDNTLLILRHKLRRKNVQVVKEYAEGLPAITGSGSALNQIWTNLIDNAIDAVPENGRVTVRTLREPDDVLVEIADNGPGIPAEVRAHLFEPFFTTKPVGEGTGLGLDTVLRLTRRHRGSVRVESVPGQTSFQVRLPLG